MEMLRKLAVGAFKATNRLRNMDGQFWVVGTYANTGRRMKLMQGELEMSARMVLELEGVSVPEVSVLDN